MKETKKPDYMEYKNETEKGSEAVWKGTSFQDAEDVYVGAPDKLPKHIMGED